MTSSFTSKWYNSNQGYDDILMKDIVDEMKAFWNSSVLYILTKVSEFLLSIHLAVCACIPTAVHLHHPSPFQNAIAVLSSYLVIWIIEGTELVIIRGKQLGSKLLWFKVQDNWLVKIWHVNWGDSKANFLSVNRFSEQIEKGLMLAMSAL